MTGGVECEQRRFDLRTCGHPRTHREPDWSLTYVDGEDFEETSRQWHAVMAGLSAAGTLADANGHTVVRFVEFRVQYRTAKHVAESGAILSASEQKSANGIHIGARCSKLMPALSTTVY
ncbi:hypothetical protein SAMN02927900_04599 [Rhizobium mongolense subsp. loessense]|uniref:Uncharacterized protein n=1 Tax=Rhizobium mongolense subsp. loessense TaxID=158890 RepID=A0A1G4T436_9HYPH|nr:hypothetical protein [Rhizobium mongolense]SCW76036.1 hypothetical protein SAMN02927900_04599 [Rhizobium mongolense subsp. loessense]